jgi:hypothetical protein
MTSETTEWLSNKAKRTSAILLVINKITAWNKGTRTSKKGLEDENSQTGSYLLLDWNSVKMISPQLEISSISWISTRERASNQVCWQTKSLRIGDTWSPSTTCWRLETVHSRLGKTCCTWIREYSLMFSKKLTYLADRCGTTVISNKVCCWWLLSWHDFSPCIQWSTLSLTLEYLVPYPHTEWWPGFWVAHQSHQYTNLHTISRLITELCPLSYHKT